MEVIQQEQLRSKLRWSKPFHKRSQKETMAPLAELKEKRLPVHKEGTSSEAHKHPLMSVASTRSREKEAFDGAVKKPMDADMKTRRNWKTHTQIGQVGFG